MVLVWNLIVPVYPPKMLKIKENDCEACKKLRLGLTWVGDPPKCREHTKKKQNHKEWS